MQIRFGALCYCVFHYHQIATCVFKAMEIGFTRLFESHFVPSKFLLMFLVQIHSSFSFSSAFNLYWGKSIHCLTRGYLWRVMPIARRLTPQSNSSLAQLLPSNSVRSLCHFPMLAGDSYRIWNDNKTTNSLLTPNQPLTRTFQLGNTFPCIAPLHLSKLAKAGICTVGLHFHGGTCGRRSGSYCILLQLYGLRGLYHVLILGFLAGKVWGFLGYFLTDPVEMQLDTLDSRWIPGMFLEGWIWISCFSKTFAWQFSRQNTHEI